ncbi:MAG: hypothetical protein AB8C95_04735 [Phycisphaeraceae bacterium]
MDEHEKNQDQPTPSQQGNVGGLIAEVESKMSELMAWHKTQVSQFEKDKTKFEAELLLQREAIKAEGEEQAEALKTKAEQQEKAYEAKVEENNQAISSQRESLDDQMNKVEKQRIKLVELTSKLRAQESAISREWGEVQKEREAVQKRADEVTKMREQTQERAKAWLETTAIEISEPLKLATDRSEEHEGAGEAEAERHHEAA